MIPQFSRAALLQHLTAHRCRIFEMFHFLAHEGEWLNLGENPTRERVMAYGQLRLIESLIADIQLYPPGPAEQLQEGSP
jgi:hypothetical protein